MGKETYQVKELMAQSNIHKDYPLRAVYEKWGRGGGGFNTQTTDTKFMNFQAVLNLR